MDPKTARIKAMAGQVLADIDAGKVVVATTVVHLSEMANVLKNPRTGIGLAESLGAIDRLLGNPKVRVLDVSASLFRRALDYARVERRDPGDALAHLVMREVLHTLEIYTTDASDFPGFTILPEPEALAPSS